MVIEKIYAMPTTNISLSDRFTILQNVRPVSIGQRRRYGSKMHSDLELDHKQRRIVERLALKTITQAASALQKRTLKQRLGTPNRPVKVLNKYKLSKPLKRKNIGQRSLIDAKPQVTRNNRKARRNRPIKRKDPRNKVNRNDGSQLNNQQNVNFTRGRGSRRRGLLRGQTGGQTMTENFGMSNAEMRGRGNSRGRGINRSWFGRKATLTKEELDKQLDVYMSGTKLHLDKELDSYMNAMDVE